MKPRQVISQQELEKQYPSPARETEVWLGDRLLVPHNSPDLEDLPNPIED